MRSLAFSSDGLKIVTTSEDEIVRVWDALTGQAQANSQAQSLVHFGKDQYFVEVSTGHHMSKVPTEFNMDRYDMPVSGPGGGSSSDGFGWRTVNGQRHIPVVIVLSSS
ncbi:hypothetical protein FIBSPDRAFT_786866 [Athelia psychrophila]|uniref:Uncharacterized protein n=1 Tax=Athelia psychrophila TaxID=1759441 RepID=A0A166LCH1_9AGAM|nr:hypothetical protein FIBSPDRAFT_786866 [Fibularhizoctonia sp. CBS 109695]